MPTIIPFLQFISLPFLIIAALVLLIALYLLRKKVLLMSANNNKFKSVFESIWRIEKSVLETTNFDEATKQVVNIILTELGYVNHGYEVIVLTLLDEEQQGLKRIAISNTEAAGRFLQATPIPFNNILIPLSATDNLSVRSVYEKKMFTTPHVSEVLSPAIDGNWVEDFQKTLGIKTSIVYPIIAKEKILGTLIFSLSKEKDNITDEEWSILDSFVGAVGIALDNALLFRSLKETTQKLTDANVRLQEIDKLKDEFVSLASHELRTPMTAIKSYVWLLLHGNAGEISDQQKLYLSRTYASTERMINMVNDMLNISRIESGRFTINRENVDMVKLVEEVVIEVAARAEEVHVNVGFNKPGGEFIAWADSNKVKEVLINLIGNSIKFTPEGGFITILISKDQYGNVLTSIKDTGRGIKAESIGGLFQKFHMLGGGPKLTKEKGQGTGLGLYISKKIIELHGGKIWAESEGEGKGAVFNFTLPPNNQAVTNQLPVQSQQEENLPSQPNPQG